MGSAVGLNLFLLLHIFLKPVTASINIEEIAELCPGNFITQDYNASWENTRQFTKDVLYYLPLASKYYVYAMTQFLYQTSNFKLLTEAHLENSCLVGNKLNGWEHVNVTGYDKTFRIRMYPTPIPKLFRIHLPLPTGGFSGFASIALSDNENYIVFDYCFDNGLRAFAVKSTNSYLDEISLAVIKAHLKAVGFKERNFIYSNYLACFDIRGNVAPDPETLPIPDSPHSREAPLAILSDNFLYPIFVQKKK